MAQMTSRAPLTPIVFEILLSLLEKKRHGYDVMQQVEERTAGRVRLLPGTLYRAIHRLIEDGLVQEAGGRNPATDDPRRVYYRLTDEGLDAVRAEAERLEASVRYARSKNLLGHHGRS